MRLQRQLLFPIIGLVLIPTVGMLSLAIMGVNQLADTSSQLAKGMEESHAKSTKDAELAREVARTHCIEQAENSLNWVLKDLQTQINRLSDLHDTIRSWPAFRLAFAKDSKTRENNLAQLTFLLNGLTQHQNLTQATLLDIHGHEIIHCAGVLIPPGGDPLLDGTSTNNVTSDEDQSDWYKQLASNIDHEVALQRDPDFPDYQLSLSVNRALIIRASRLSTNLSQTDGIMRLSIAAADMLIETMAAASSRDCIIYIRASDQSLWSQKNGAIIQVDENVLQDTDRVLARKAFHGAIDIIAAIPHGGIDRSAIHVDPVLTRLRTGMQEVSSLNEFVAHTRNSLNRLGMLAFGLLIVLVAFGLWWIRHILLSPLAHIMANSQLLAAGNLDNHIHTDVDNEIGALGLDLERMRLELRGKVRALEFANSDLERATKLKSQFLANMSHEIRTPMNGVLGMAQLIEATILNDEQRDLLGTLRTSGEAMLAVINDILDLSKIEAGEMKLEQIPCDIRSITDAVTDVSADAAHAKGISICALVDEKLGRSVISDPTRLRQILLNLTSNAIKFTTAGGIALIVTIKERTNDGCVLEIALKDTGIGIPPQSLDHLFKPFSQADGSTTRRFGGTGLGLAICKHLVEAMGGQIHVTSVVGQGSVFASTIPFTWGEMVSETPPLAGRTVVHYADAGQVADATRAHLRAAGATVIERPLSGIRTPEDDGAVPIVDLGHGDALLLPDPGCLVDLKVKPILIIDRRRRHQLGDRFRDLTSAIINGPARYDALVRALRHYTKGTQPETTANLSNNNPLAKRILLVEDILVNRTVAQTFLRRLGCEVIWAENGKVAIAKCADDRFDAILMDCQMPEMDGFAATRHLRHVGTTACNGSVVPIIGLTAGAMDDDIRACKESGMDDVLTKPVNLEVLGRTLRHWTNIKRNDDSDSSALHRAAVLKPPQ